MLAFRFLSGLGGAAPQAVSFFSFFFFLFFQVLVEEVCNVRGSFC